MKKEEIEKRLSNGDIFLNCENKMECPHCKAMLDADKANYCTKCGEPVREGVIPRVRKKIR